MTSGLPESPTTGFPATGAERWSAPHNGRPVLPAANDRLLALRAAQARPGDDGHRPYPASRRPLPPLPPISPLASAPFLADLPAHLGWESAAVTAVLRRRLAAPARVVVAGTAASAQPAAAIRAAPAVSAPVALGPVTFAPAPPDRGGASPPPPATMIKLHPSLALAMLRTEQTACSRLWLLLRALDSDGRGCLPLAAVCNALTRRDSRLRLCGPRHLRSLLRQGAGLFWQRDRSHLWLASTVKVAARLGVVRLTGRPVALPLPVLTQPIGLVRAHLYASFHSSRMRAANGAGEPTGRPISRAVLTALSGRGRRTQQAYEQRAQVQVRRNIALGAPATPPAVEETAWRQGPAAFVFRDQTGRAGQPGRRYVAWQLPNSYGGPHTHRGRGRQRQLNRQLADLRNHGDAGNGLVGGELFARRRYAGNSVAAARCWQHYCLEADVYWQPPSRRLAGLWYVWAVRQGGG